MRFNDAQLEEYRERGYAVVDCPWPEQLTEACLAAVEKVARDPSEGPEDGKRNHFRLRPQITDSFWCALDHSLPFMRIILHPEIDKISY